MTNSGNGSGAGVCQAGQSLACARDEPIKAVRRQSKEISEFADGRKDRSGIELDRNAADKCRQIKFDRLRAMRDIGDAKQRFAIIFPQISQNLAVFRIEERERSRVQTRDDGIVPRACAASNSGSNADRAPCASTLTALVSVKRVHDRR